MAEGKKLKGWMRILMVMTYKGYPIMIRQLGETRYMWDTVVNNQFFSSYIEILPAPGKKKLNRKELDEVVKMCYAGAATTVDTLLGIELSDTDKAKVKMFEKARKQMEVAN